MATNRVGAARAIRAFLGLLVAAVLCLPATVGASQPPSAIGEIAPGRVIVKLRVGSTMRSAASSYGALGVAAGPTPGDQIWTVAPGSERAIAQRLAGRSDVEYAEPD